MNIVYGVRWIEVEYGWGDRPEGFVLYSDKEECISETVKSSEKGNCSGGYIGPVRPLHIIEIPFDSLEVELQERINEVGLSATSNYWEPKFKGDIHYI